MNGLIPRGHLLASRPWLVPAGVVAIIAFVATLLSYAVALTALEVSPILLVPGFGSVMLARFGRSLWPGVVLGDAIGQVVMHDRALVLVAATVAIHALACIACATWIQRTRAGIGDLGRTMRYLGIAAAVSLGSAAVSAPVLLALHDIPPQFDVAEIFGWLAMGYFVGFVVGGGLVLAWTDPAHRLRAALRQPIALACVVMVTVTAGVGFLAEVGPLVPLALAGALGIAGRSGARWGTAAIFAIALVAIEAPTRGIHPPFGGQDPAEQAANAMLALGLFAAAVLLLAAYRDSGEGPRRAPVMVALIFGALMLVAGVTALAANEVALNRTTPYVLSGLLSLGAAIGLGLLRVSRTPDVASHRRGIALAVAAGAVYVLNLALYLEAVPLIGSGPATGLTMTAPLAIVLLGMIVYRTRPATGVIVAVVPIAAGAALLAADAVGDPTGIALALASAVVFGISVIITKQALAHANVVDVALASALSAAVVALCIGIATEGMEAFDLTAAQYGALALAALGAQLVPTLGRSWALSNISADVVGAEGVLAPVTTTVLSFWFLDAVTDGGEVAGLMLIAGGAVIAALAGSRDRGDTTTAPAPAAANA